MHVHMHLTLGYRVKPEVPIFWFWESSRAPTWKDDILKTPTCNAHYRPWGHEEMNAVHRAQSSAAEMKFQSWQCMPSHGPPLSVLCSVCEKVFPPLEGPCSPGSLFLL